MDIERLTYPPLKLNYQWLDHPDNQDLNIWLLCQKPLQQRHQVLNPTHDISLVLPSRQVMYDLQKRVKKQVAIEGPGLLKKMRTNVPLDD